MNKSVRHYRTDQEYCPYKGEMSRAGAGIGAAWPSIHREPPSDAPDQPPAGCMKSCSDLP